MIAPGNHDDFRFAARSTTGVAIRSPTSSSKSPGEVPIPREICAKQAAYQVRDAIFLNSPTVETWLFRPPSTVTTWPVK